MICEADSYISWFISGLPFENPLWSWKCDARQGFLLCCVSPVSVSRLQYSGRGSILWVYKTDLVSISFCISKVEDMLDICRGRDLGDVNIALSKVLFLMTVWQKREAGTGRFSDIIKVLEHNCSPKLRGEVSFYVAMWHIASNATIEE